MCCQAPPLRFPVVCGGGPFPCLSPPHHRRLCTPPALDQDPHFSPCRATVLCLVRPYYAEIPNMDTAKALGCCAWRLRIKMAPVGPRVPTGFLSIFSESGVFMIVNNKGNLVPPQGSCCYFFFFLLAIFWCKCVWNTNKNGTLALPLHPSLCAPPPHWVELTNLNYIKDKK